MTARVLKVILVAVVFALAAIPTRMGFDYFWESPENLWSRSHQRVHSKVNVCADIKWTAALEERAVGWRTPCSFDVDCLGRSEESRRICWEAQQRRRRAAEPSDR
jgi:hypothetical protein